MPVYAYHCPNCGIFEAYAGLDAGTLACPNCAQSARRRPFSSVPYIKGETVAKAIPDGFYRQEAEHRELKQQGWDLDRSVRHLRKGLVEDKDGHRSFDMRKAATAT